MTTTSNDLRIHSKTGYLELIVGPMWSGKTSTLLTYYRQFCFCKLKVCVVNFKADDRYSETMLSTHDKQMIPCIMGFSMEEIMQVGENAKQINECDVILVNEGQGRGQGRGQPLEPKQELINIRCIEEAKPD